MESIQNIDKLIGRSVLSLGTANKLGEVDDLFVDPEAGQLAGVSVKRPDESYASVEHRDIHSIGPDAVMINQDDSLLPSDQLPLKDLPLAKNQLIGVKVITEGGQLIGSIASLFVHLTERPEFIYEVRSSIFDKLLGHAFYLPGSVGAVLADDRTALVISVGVETMDRSLDAVTKRLLAPREVHAYRAGGIQVTVRSHSD
jgi:uncharacterized protein YrrD